MVKHLLNGVLDDKVLVDCQLWVHRLRNKHWQHPEDFLLGGYADDDGDDNDDDDDDGDDDDDDSDDDGEDNEDRPCSKQCDC